MARNFQHYQTGSADLSQGRTLDGFVGFGYRFGDLSSFLPPAIAHDRMIGEQKAKIQLNREMKARSKKYPTRLDAGSERAGWHRVGDRKAGCLLGGHTLDVRHAAA